MFMYLFLQWKHIVTHKNSKDYCFRGEIPPSKDTKLTFSGIREMKNKCKKVDLNPFSILYQPDIPNGTYFNSFVKKKR